MIKKMFDFEKLDDGWELIKYNYDLDPRITRLEIPSKYKFHKVKSIAPKAFGSAIYLKSVVVPETVTNIGAAAFAFCEKLTEVVLPQWLKIIDYNTFKHCTSLRHITLPAKTAVIRSFAFSGCAALEEVALPEMLCVIYNGAFEDCEQLREVRFPDSEVTILGKAFGNCPSLSAETAMYSLICANDLNKPFAGGGDFEWDVALRSDVFPLAIEHNSFTNIGKEELFKQLIDRDLIDYMPLAENMLNDGILDELVNYSAECGQTEFTARLLNFKNGSSSDIDDIIEAKFSL
ncbi:MAG: leucine-rich repeat domain-containing protein [Oscillospiraceae bacterium]|nr:leucine-rich repeat domain-containing protein [Oscillospiraceae bacterium]